MLPWWGHYADELGGHHHLRQDTDYSFDAATGTGERISTGSIPAGTVASPTTLKATYTWADPSKVQPSDVIGTVNAAGQRTGMKALRDGYQLFGYYPKIIIAPVFQHPQLGVH